MPAASCIFPAILLIDIACQSVNIAPLWLSLYKNTQEVLARLCNTLALPEVDRKEEAFISLKVKFSTVIQTLSFMICLTCSRSVNACAV